MTVPLLPHTAMERLRKTRANAFDGARSDAHLDEEDAFLLVSSG